MREQSEAARGGARGEESARIVHETNNPSLAAAVQHDGAAFRDLFRTRTTPSAFGRRTAHAREVASSKYSYEPFHRPPSVSVGFTAPSKDGRLPGRLTAQRRYAAESVCIDTRRVGSPRTGLVQPQAPSNGSAHALCGAVARERGGARSREARGPRS